QRLRSSDQPIEEEHAELARRATLEVTPGVQVEDSAGRAALGGGHGAPPCAESPMGAREPSLRGFTGKEPARKQPPHSAPQARDEAERPPAAAQAVAQIGRRLGD